MKIGIDSGHGGKDPGAIGSAGLKEKDATLAVGLELDEMLRFNGFETVLTRTKDVFMELADRSNLLNKAKCDLAVSIHVNSATSKTANYISTFIQARGGKAETLAIFVQRHLAAATSWPDGGVRVQNLHMTRETAMPAILVELGFISNLDQEKWLAVPENQKKLAEAIAKGVCDFAGSPYVKETESLIGEDFDADARVVYKGKELSAGIVMLKAEGKTFVELRALAELLGLAVSYDNATKTVTLS